MLADKTVSTFVFEHRDRLALFGTRILEAALSAAARRPIVVDPMEIIGDLVVDMIAILTSFGERLLRSAFGSHSRHRHRAGARALQIANVVSSWIPSAGSAMFHDPAAA